MKVLKRTGGYIFLFLLIPIVIGLMYVSANIIIPGILPLTSGQNSSGNLAYIIIAIPIILTLPYLILKIFFKIARLRDRGEKEIKVSDLVKGQDELDGQS